MSKGNKPMNPLEAAKRVQDAESPVSVDRVTDEQIDAILRDEERVLPPEDSTPPVPVEPVELVVYEVLEDKVIFTHYGSTHIRKGDRVTLEMGEKFIQTMLESGVKYRVL